MTKKESMDRLDEWERREIVRRVTQEKVPVELAIYQVRLESNALYHKIVFSNYDSPVSSTEEPLPSKEVL